MSKQYQIGDLFARSELEAARKICDELGEHASADAISERVVKPILSRINAATGQENDPKYFAYALLYALGKKA